MLVNSQPGTIGSSFIPISSNSCLAGSQFVAGRPPAGFGMTDGDTDKAESGVLSLDCGAVAAVFPAVAETSGRGGKGEGGG